ncbi:L-type lectin-domain containing receptor kinase IX.1-like [Typha latifolia]|uniref:L-type lectin-domain containing receptor kinase IX.1-like n=1 Tax=Typha latifolia TaxID=4733 RepID=UPI003C2EE2BB
MAIFAPSPPMSPHNFFHSFLTFTFFSISLLIPSANPLSFTYNFSALIDDTPDMIDFQGDAFFNKVIKLTKDELIGPITSSAGRAVYGAPIQLYDTKSGHLANFATRFSFVINATDDNYYGDGLAFFLSPYPSRLPEDSTGGYLGLFNRDTAEDAAANEMVAVEFDSYKNEWDPSSNHVGINLNTINSTGTTTWGSSMRDGRMGNAWVNYNANTKNLSVFLTYDDHDNAIFLGLPIISYTVDLRELLPEQVAIGFSAATGQAAELHKILYWEFSSDLDPKKGVKIELLVILAVGIGVLIFVIGLISFLLWKKRARRWRGEEEGDGMDYDELTDEFEKRSGPKRFLYSELLLATNNFAAAGKLGEGGFGAVYRGFLRTSNLSVAIKRISKASKQGRKEYVSEVKIISQLRHRNLVQLLGWCHDRRDFLLVYELMPNGSLDSHLYTNARSLTWPVRYRIALGLASAVLYLHEEWDHCVVHRDIKPSNVMLDASFNAKLGDFGLARFVDHDGVGGSGGTTTVLAGTMGYLAPECITTGNSGKESDVYSFGVVALEIACGRRPSEPDEEPSRVRLVPWVWEMYGRKQVIEASDARLNSEFEEQEMERLMVVGLWCAHPDYNLRPTIRQAISVLKFEAPLPGLPSKMPVPTFYQPPIDSGILSYTLTEGTRSTPDPEVGSHASSSTSSSSSSSSSEKLLQS